MLLSVLATLVSVGVGQAEMRILTLDPAATQIVFRLGSTLHSVEGNAPLSRGEIHFDSGGGPASGEIVIDARRTTTGLSLRDEKMHEQVLDSARFPRIVFHAQRLDVKAREAKSAEIELSGTLELLGKEHPMVLPARLTSADGERIEIETRATLPYVDWGLTDMSNFLLHVDKEVTVDVHTAGLLRQ